MSLSFNLLDEPFVPCVMRDGQRSELSLKQVLIRAHEVLEIRDQSPLVTIALHRLLLGILHRTFGPASFTRWRRMWEAGRFDREVLHTYFEQWHHRFNLFDPEQPFYQIGGMSTDKPLPAAALFDELACNNNPTLFDHTINEPARPIGLAAAARGLIARQGFALGLGVSPDVRINGQTVKTGNRRDGPLARGLLLLVRGDNLFQTLLCNLTAYAPDEDDRPAWEQKDPERLMSASRVAGRVDLYTCQSRRLRLEMPEEADDPPTVAKVHFAQGREVSKDEIDPMKPYWRDDKQGWRVFTLSEDRAIWRDSPSLLDLASNAHRPVAALNWVAQAIAQGILPVNRIYTLDAFGIGTQPGKATSIILWRHERMPLPLAYLSDRSLVEGLRTALTRAEEVAQALHDAVRSMVVSMLTPAGQKPDRDRVQGKLSSIGCTRLYWSRLEVPFRQFLVDLPGDSSHRQQRLAQWVCCELRRHAEAAFEETAGRFDQAARTLRALALSREELARNLNIISKPHKEHLHEQKP